MTTTRRASTTTVRTADRRRAGRPSGNVPVTDRDRLLEAAERAIAAHGPLVSLETIALEADVTKPVLYQYVGNKDALVTALAERHMVRINAAVAQATGHERDGRERVHRFVATFFDVVAADPNLYLFLATRSGEGHSQHGATFADQAARPLATVLARQRIGLGADPSVATAWAYGTVGLLHHVTLWWLREPSATLDRLVDDVTELLWSGMGGTATQPDGHVGGAPHITTRSTITTSTTTRGDDGP